MESNGDFLDRKRIIIKLGTESIISMGYVDPDKLRKVSEEVSELKNLGKQIALVSSGAIAAGRCILQKYNGIKDETIIEKQRLASIGQPNLINSWENELIKHKLYAGQFLVDYDDFESKKKFGSMANVYEDCLNNSCVPIFNENDTMAVDEICFGDNDILAAYVATRLKNDLLVICTTKDGIYKNGKIIPYATSFDADFYDKLEDSACGRGGIESKLKAAKICNENGIPCIVSNIAYKLQDILKGEAPRTVFHNK